MREAKVNIDQNINYVRNINVDQKINFDQNLIYDQKINFDKNIYIVIEILRKNISGQQKNKGAIVHHSHIICFCQN